jgi:hypothetical protein
MESIRDFFDWIADEWSVILSAPFTFLLGFAILGYLVWRFTRSSFEVRVANYESTISLLERRLQRFDEKLDGATPDEAKARMDELEARVEALSPRRISPAQREIIAHSLRAYSGNSIHVSTDTAVADSGTLSRGIAAAFSAAGWIVKTSICIGIGDPPVSGIALRVSKSSQLSEVEAAIADTFTAAEIQFDIQSGFEPNPHNNPASVAEILVTGRIH